MTVVSAYRPFYPTPSLLRLVIKLRNPNDLWSSSGNPLQSIRGRKHVLRLGGSTTGSVKLYFPLRTASAAASATAEASTASRSASTAATAAGTTHSSQYGVPHV